MGQICAPRMMDLTRCRGPAPTIKSNSIPSTVRSRVSHTVGLDHARRWCRIPREVGHFLCGQAANLQRRTRSTSGQASYQSRGRHIDGVRRASPGGQAKRGDNVLVKEALNTLSLAGVLSKLAHEHRTGSSQLVRIIHPALRYALYISGRSTSKRMLSAADKNKLVGSR